MRQHVNPLSRNFDEIERIPFLIEMFGDPKLNPHLDIGCASGEFLFDLALVNTSWNYLGIEIREKLVKKAKLKMLEREIKNLYFLFGNANNILNDVQSKFIDIFLSSDTRMHNIHNYDNSKFKSNSLMFNYYVF